jgi:hypothetical protein
MIISPESPRCIIKHRQTEYSKFDPLHARTSFHPRWKTFHSTLFRSGRGLMDDYIHVFLELLCFPLQPTSLYSPQSSFYSHQLVVINFASDKKFGLADIGRMGIKMNATLGKECQTSETITSFVHGNSLRSISGLQVFTTSYSKCTWSVVLVCKRFMWRLLLCETQSFWASAALNILPRFRHATTCVRGSGVIIILHGYI